MQDLILLILGALFVYLLFSRKGGMGMGCCGGHGSYGEHSDHGHQDRTAATAVMELKLTKPGTLMSYQKTEKKRSLIFVKINIQF